MVAPLLVLLIAIIAGYRLLLARSGQLYWADEFRYLHALHFLDDLRHGHTRTAAGWLFGEYTGARPGYILLSTVPAALQGLAYVAAGIAPESQNFYLIPVIFNVAISLAAALVFFRLLVMVTADQWLALAGTVVYSLLTNTNIYARHLFPFDLALLLLLGSLVLVTNQSTAPRLFWRVVAAGLLSGLAYTTYPGYDPFAVVLVAAILFVLFLVLLFLSKVIT